MGICIYAMDIILWAILLFYALTTVDALPTTGFELIRSLMANHDATGADMLKVALGVHACDPFDRIDGRWCAQNCSALDVWASSLDSCRYAFVQVLPV